MNNDRKNKELSNSVIRRSNKKLYQSPKLTIHGTLQEITKATRVGSKQDAYGAFS